MKVLRPVGKEYRISSKFGQVDKGLRDGKPHKGVDFACPAGTPVRACFDGVIALLRTEKEPVGDDKASIQSRKGGNRVGLYNASHRALYFHLSAFLCDAGDKVLVGQVIALSGNSGNSTGPHLHHELRILNTDESIEPEYYYDNDHDDPTFT